MTRPTLLLAWTLAMAVHGIAAAQSANQPAGHWEGAIQVPGQALAIEVDLAPRDEKWVGTIAIPAQNLAFVEAGGSALRRQQVDRRPDESGRSNAAIHAGVEGRGPDRRAAQEHRDHERS